MKKFKNIISLISLIIFSYINIYLFYIRFSTSDDYLLNNIISGTYGNTYDYQLLYINNILGLILKICYHIIPRINIYTLYLITLLCICVLQVIEYIWKNKKYTLLPIVFILYTLTLYNITYTIIAYLSITIGFLEIIFQREKKPYLAYFLIINGNLLRSQAFIPVFAVLGTVLLIRLLKNKNLKQIRNVFILLIAIIALNILGNLMYKTDRILNEFKQWQDASINIRDYKQIDYNKYKENFNEVNWNENDLKLFYSWNFADKEKFTTQSMQKIAENVEIKDRYNLNLKKIIYNFINQYLTKKFDINNIYIIIFIIAFIVAFVRSKSKKECLYVFIATLFFNLALIVRERYIYRVVYPQYLLAILYYIYQITTDNTENKKTTKSRYALVLNIVICVIFTIFFIYKYNEQSNYFRQKYKENTFFIEQVKNEGALYIADSITYNNLTMNYKITERKNIGEYTFLIKAGGGDCFSKRYYNYLRKFELENLDNLYKNLKKENVYYIGYINEILTQYLKENIDESWELKNIKIIDNITIYKYQEETKNN